MFVDIFDVHIPHAACPVPNAKSYTLRCELLSCEVGWKVSANKTKCEANQCSCPNGVGAEEAKCPRDGDVKCESCDPGFKLASGAKACVGTLWRLRLLVLVKTHYSSSCDGTLWQMYMIVVHATEYML